MNFKLELPEGTILINRTELKEAIQEMFAELHAENAEEEIMTIREAAEYLKVSVPTVRNMIANKEIPFFQRGQVIRLNRRDVKEWIRNNSQL
ncbi:helix-turn-helix domain-containing protein [Priestia aryabhattai]|uniref:helix-turn-helix domain-containing protein n=1 Tax=Priestia aryabhattai TaxID=412384 RepID=UPI0036D1C22D